MPEKDKDELIEEENNEEIKEEGDISDKNVKKNVKRKKSKKAKKNTAKKVFAVVVLIAVLAVILYFAFRTSLMPKKFIATVNGEIITQDDLDKKYDQLPDQYKLVITKDAFLDQMVNVKLLLQEAKKIGIIVSDDEVEEELNNIKKQVPSEEAFEQLLEQRKIELYDLKKQIEEQLIINRLLNDTVISKIKISDSKISDYYNANKEKFEAKQGEIRVRHILVPTEEAAKETLKSLQSGLDFSDLAKLKSIDTGSAQRGGDLGFIKKGQMVKEFEDAAFALKVSQLSPIVKTQFGYHIIKREANKVSYEEAKEQIRQILSIDTSNLAIETYINQLKLNSTITKEGVKITKEIKTFTKTADSICMEDGRPIIRLYSTTDCKPCNWIAETFDSLANEYDSIAVYHWQLDTGDNTLTEMKEDAIPKSELELFKKYNEKSTVPTYVFGCKYVRVGNSYKTVEEEKAEFERVIEQLTG